MSNAEETVTVQAPNRTFSGERAGVAFEAGEGEATIAQARELHGRGYAVPAFGEISEKLATAPLPVPGTATPLADALEEAGSDDEGVHEEPDGTEDAEAAIERLVKVDGVGKGYARRLTSVGIETTGALRAAVAGELAEDTGISADRIEGFQEAATGTA